MIEKLKDILYEMSDVLLAFLIILLMSTVITWKVTDSLAYTREKEPAVVSQESEPADDITEEESTDTTEEEASNTPVETTNTPQENTASNTKTTQSAPVAVVVAPAPKASVVQINVPMGTTGSGIAKLLKEQGLIENTAKFVARVEELKLASKLRSGKFSIQSGTSLDDVIYIITGTKK